MFFTQDKTGTSCPSCRSQHDIRYIRVPASQRTYQLQDETCVEQFAESRDYVCEDCGQKWNMENCRES